MVITSEKVNSLIAPQYVAEGETVVSISTSYCLLVKAMAHKSPFSTLYLQSRTSNPGRFRHPARGMKAKCTLNVQRGLWLSAEPGQLMENGSWSSPAFIGRSHAPINLGQVMLNELAILETFDTLAYKYDAIYWMKLTTYCNSAMD